MNTVSYFTSKGLEKLQKELHHLKTTGRSDIARQIAEAREKGDLSENAEYDAAKDAQGLLELKISKLEETLANARPIDESKLDVSKVLVLSKVKIKNTKTGQTLKYTLVSEDEADLKAGRISINSPIGKGLLGKAEGEEVQITVPAGTLHYRILKITRE